MADHVQVQFTVGDRSTADVLATALVEQRFAACVQVLGPVTSRYWWDGAIEQAEEWLCLAKTTAGQADALVAAVVERHPYDVPEVLVVPVTGAQPYLDWIGAAVE